SGGVACARLLGRLAPNKRLNLAGGDRSKGNGVLCAVAHELSFNLQMCWRASRPQLKRDPLGSSTLHPSVRDEMPERSRMRALVISLNLVVAVSLVSPVQVHAQSADSTRGGWGEFALGYGSLHAFSGASGGGRHMDGYSFL